MAKPSKQRSATANVTPDPIGILSIQSHVAFGHVGNAAAVFPLQRLGFEVWPIHTVQFSNHTGYETWTGQVFTADHIAELVEGLAQLGVLARCQALLSGYLGDAAVGHAVVRAVARLRGANRQALYACDPVLGDRDRGLYVRPAIPGFMRDEAVPLADIITPNQFELERLTGIPVDSLDQALEATAAARRLGPSIVLLTSLRRRDGPADSIEMLVATGEGSWLVATPLLRLDPMPNGAGDVVAALFLGHYLRTRSAPAALDLAAATIFALLEATGAAGARELQLVAAQDHIARPPRRFPLQQVG